MLTVYIFCSQSSIKAQGDQILDGIGETGLIARYVFDNDQKDWSRNNLHAEIHGDAKFVEDDFFKSHFIKGWSLCVSAIKCLKWPGIHQRGGLDTT